MKHKLSLEAVAKRYGDVVALHPTSLDVDAGEFLTLLGPSGSGKTTMLQLVAGLAMADGGEVWVDGKAASLDPPHKRDIGLVFQSYALFPHLTVEENIAFPLRMRRVEPTEIVRRVKSMLDIVQLPDMADRFPKELSGGQQQRVALARCAVYEPSVILMDEPLGALDKGLREDMQFEIKRIHRELGATILYVTHDQDEAMAMSDRICLMRDGRVEQLGTPSDLYFSPRTVFAARFLGNSNLLEGRLLRREGADAIVRLSGGAEVVARMPCKGCEAGAAVLVLVRAESVRTVRSGIRLENQVEATLEFSVIVGSVTRQRWRLADNTQVSQVKLTHPHEAAKIGSREMIGWEKANALALPEDGSG